MVQRHALTRAAALLVAAGFAGAAAPAAAHDHRHADEAGATASAADLPPAPEGLERRLEDRTRRSGPGRIAWSTTWSLCWQPVAGAVHYEARLMTAEGAARTPRRLDGTCYRVEAAAGENRAAEGMPQRRLMLAMQAAQSSLLVRAVFADGRTSAWTAEQPVGTAD